MGLAACDATQSTSTDPLVNEGARITATGVTSFAVPGIDGRLVAKATREWANDAVVTNGLAAAEKVGTKATDAVMPYLAIADDNMLVAGAANQRQFFGGKDRNGNLQDFVIINGDGGPAKTIVHLENGKISQAYSFEWKKVRGGWLATSFAVTVFKDGKVLGRITSSRKSVPGGPAMAVASDDPCFFDASVPCENRYGGELQGGGGGGSSGGGGNYGYGDCSCTAELQDYLAAAAAFAAATQIAIDAGQLANPWFWIGTGAAGAYVYILLMRYKACVDRCRRLYGDSGDGSAGAVSTLLFVPTNRFFLRPA